MISLLVYLLLMAVAFALVYWILQVIPLPQPFKQIVLALVLVIFLLFVLGLALGWFAPPRAWHLP